MMKLAHYPQKKNVFSRPILGSSVYNRRKGNCCLWSDMTVRLFPIHNCLQNLWVFRKHFPAFLVYAFIVSFFLHKYLQRNTKEII